MKKVVSYRVQAKNAGINISNSDYSIHESEGHFETYSEENSLGKYSNLPDARRAIVEYVYQSGATGISFTQL
jgi:hypothetical protein